MSAAATAAGYLVVSNRAAAALGRMQRAMDGIFEGGKKRDARRAAELASKCINGPLCGGPGKCPYGCSTAPTGARR